MEAEQNREAKEDSVQNKTAYYPLDVLQLPSSSVISTPIACANAPLHSLFLAQNHVEFALFIPHLDQG
jgi:hypothetical protein